MRKPWEVEINVLAGLVLILTTLACGSLENGENLAVKDAPDQQLSSIPKPTFTLDAAHTDITRDLDGTPVRGEYTMEIQVGTSPQTFEVVMDDRRGGVQAVDFAFEPGDSRPGLHRELLHRLRPRPSAPGLRADR